MFITWSALYLYVCVPVCVRACMLARVHAPIAIASTVLDISQYFFSNNCGSNEILILGGNPSINIIIDAIGRGAGLSCLVARMIYGQ